MTSQVTYLFRLVLVACLVASGCLPKSVPSGGMENHGCKEPPPDTFTSVGVDAHFTQSTFWKVVMGDVGVKIDPSVMSLASNAARSALVRDYLRCLAMNRDHFSKAQVIYLDSVNAFLETRPTPEAYMQWQKMNPFPARSDEQTQQIANQVSGYHSRIVVSKFVIKQFDAADNPNNGYQIDLHMINRGNIPGYAPVNNFSFRSVEKPPTDTEIEEEMGKVIKLALQQFPTRKDHNREQLEVGVEHFTMLPSGLTKESYTMISSGQKVFYLFVALTYYDDSLPMGQFWVSEFCGWQGKDFSYFQLCKGHNKTWLYKS